MTATPGAAVMFYIHFALATHFFLIFLNQFLKYPLYLQKVQKDKWAFRCKMESHIVFLRCIF